METGEYAITTDFYHLDSSSQKKNLSLVEFQVKAGVSQNTVIWGADEKAVITVDGRKVKVKKDKAAGTCSFKSDIRKNGYRH